MDPAGCAKSPVVGTVGVPQGLPSISMVYVTLPGASDLNKAEHEIVVPDWIMTEP